MYKLLCWIAGHTFPRYDGKEFGECATCGIELTDLFTHGEKQIIATLNEMFTYLSVTLDELSQE